MFYFETTSEDEKRSYTELLQRKTFDVLAIRSSRCESRTLRSECDSSGRGALTTSVGLQPNTSEN